MPQPSARIFHLSDLHFGNEDRSALDTVRSAIVAERPDLAVLTGDLTMRARRHEFAAARDWIGQLPVPVRVDIGNHDLAGYHLPERYLAPFRRFEAFRAEVETPHALSDEWCIAALNTSPPAQPRMNWSKGWIKEAALTDCLAQVDKHKAAHGEGARILVTAHHPLREVGTRGTALTHGGKAALEALAERGVLAVLSGHVHDPFDIEEPTASGAVRMIGAGTLSQRLRKTAPSYNVLRWDGAGLSCETRFCD
jgi:3',5'-cyclic AMP phosphodiesterase CpdA